MPFSSAPEPQRDWSPTDGSATGVVGLNSMVTFSVLLLVWFIQKANTPISRSNQPLRSSRQAQFVLICAFTGPCGSWGVQLPFHKLNPHAWESKEPWRFPSACLQEDDLKGRWSSYRERSARSCLISLNDMGMDRVTAPLWGCLPRAKSSAYYVLGLDDLKRGLNQSVTAFHSQTETQLVTLQYITTPSVALLARPSR